MRRVLVPVLGLALAACQAVGPGGTRVVRGKGSIVATTASPGAQPTTGPLAVTPTGAPVGGGGSLITDNGAGLVGLVRGPAGLVSNNGGAIVANNGGSLITDNGAGIVANNGGGYRLSAAPAEIPAAGYAVVVRDGAGAPVKGPDGQPLRAVTDARGRFTLASAGAGNVVAVVELGGGKGALSAFVTRDPAQRAGLAVDYVSTLTTAYIMDRYVASQAAPAEVLQRLTPEIEAETRAAAAKALASTDAAVPAALTPASVVGAVDALRKASPAFDAQMEAVRELLVVAGQSDLGAGQAAVAAALGDVSALAIAPDGAALVTCGKDGRVWRVGADGKLATAAGSAGKAELGSLAGQAAAGAALHWPAAAVAGADGLVVLDRVPAGATQRKPARDRLSRVRPDGTIEDASGAGPGPWLALFREADGGVLALVPGALVRLVPGQAPVPVATLSAAAATLVGKGQAFGRDAAGRLYVGTRSDDGAAIARLDPAGGAAETLATEGVDGVTSLALAPDGRLLLREGDALKAVSPEGARTTLLAAVPADFELLPLAPAAAAADGTWLVTRRGNQVVRVAGGAVAPFAGRAATLSADATDVALVSPAGLVAGEGGVLWLADKFAHRIYRRDPNGAVTVVAGVGGSSTASAPSTGDGGPATAAGLDRPRALRRDAAGNLYVLEAGLRARKIDPAGTITRIWQVEPGWSCRDMAIAPDGTAYYSLKSTANEDCKVICQPRDGSAALTVLPPTPLTGAVIGTSAAGLLHLLIADGAARTVKTWTPVGGFVTLGEAPVFDVSMPNDSNGLVVDFSGRVIMTLQARDLVVAWDPGTRTSAVIAGEGGAHFASAGVDGSLNVPRYPAIGPRFDLYFSDTRHKQVKRIPAGEY